MPHAPFTSANATYYWVDSPSAQSRTARLAERWRHERGSDAVVDDFLRVVDDCEPDVIHIHGSEHVGGLVAARSHRPCVVSMQGIASAYEEYSFVGLRPRQFARELASRDFVAGRGLIHQHYAMRSRARRERRIIGSCDDFMGRTAWDRAVIEALRPGAHYHHVGEVLDDVFYERAWSRERAEDQLLFAVTGSVLRKGVEVLLDAMKILASRRSLPRLRIAGDHVHGPMWKHIRPALSSSALGRQVEFLGHLPPERLADELCRASVFVHPSHIDNSPNSLCEAMLLGVPCVASWVGGVPSLVNDGESGLLYHDRDPFVLASSISRMLDEADMAERLGRRAREVALERHDPRRCADEAAQAYRSIVERYRQAGIRQS